MPDVSLDMEAGLNTLPSCFSEDFRMCTFKEPNSWPGCEDFLAYYDRPVVGPAMQDALADLPMCPEEQAFWDRTKAGLPDCYGEGIYQCLNNPEPASDPMPNCVAINMAYNWDNRMFDDLPYCPERAAAAPNWLLLGLSAGAGTLLGFAMSAALGRSR